MSWKRLRRGRQASPLVCWDSKCLPPWFFSKNGNGLQLAYGTPAERTHWQISGAGYGIHWPELDEDLGAEGLLLGKHSAESPASFERWLQRRKTMQPEYAA